MGVQANRAIPTPIGPIAHCTGAEGQHRGSPSPALDTRLTTERGASGKSCPGPRHGPEKRCPRLKEVVLWGGLHTPSS